MCMSIRRLTCLSLANKYMERCTNSMQLSKILRSCGDYEGVGHREGWATGRSEPQGGVGHRQKWATGRSGPQGGVSHME